MKRVLSLVLVAGVAFSLGHFLRAPIPHAGAVGGGAGTPSANGDVNGDGSLNLTDAIYLLQHLFQGGPAPVPIDGPQPGPCALPATGQTKCYDNEGNEISCDSAEYPGQDGAYQAGCPTQGRFVDNGDGTVTDNCTGLMWQKYTADVSGNGVIGDEDRLNWQEALKYCENLDFAGHDDWRLPNVLDLQSLFGYWRGGAATYPISYEEGGVYWSSTTQPDAPGNARDLYYGVGIIDKRKDEPYFVRAVRNAP